MMAASMRFKLTLAYDGRAFQGWQSQPNGQGVQQTIESTVARIADGEAVRVHGAGRTDRGVHATGQVAHFDAPERLDMNAGAWFRALNTNLPKQVRVMECALVDDSFNAQFDATGKHYEYRICRLQALPPLELGLAWHVPWRMDLALLERACQELIGEHDFTAFSAKRKDGRELIPGFSQRTISSINLEEHAGMLSLHFRGNSFLYKMVRLLTGSALRVALGRQPLSWLETLLHDPQGQKSQYVAPAGGLYLRAVEYAPGNHKTTGPLPVPLLEV
jgi:tRNA pseudouridine38-40 synthase